MKRTSFCRRVAPRYTKHHFFQRSNETSRIMWYKEYCPFLIELFLFTITIFLWRSSLLFVFIFLMMIFLLLFSFSNDLLMTIFLLPFSYDDHLIVIFLLSLSYYYRVYGGFYCYPFLFYFLITITMFLWRSFCCFSYVGRLWYEQYSWASWASFVVLAQQKDMLYTSEHGWWKCRSCHEYECCSMNHNQLTFNLSRDVFDNGYEAEYTRLLRLSG